MEIEFDNPAKWEKWFYKLPEADRDAVSLALDHLETFGHNLVRPHSAPLRKGLYELRVTGTPQYRLFYSMNGNTATIWTYIKKTSPEAAAKAQAAARKLMK